MSTDDNRIRAAVEAVQAAHAADLHATTEAHQSVAQAVADGLGMPVRLLSGTTIVAVVTSPPEAEK